jgi:hypothetical protein
MKTKATAKRRKTASTKAQTTKQQRPKAVKPKCGKPTSVLCDMPVNSPILPSAPANVISSEVSMTRQITRSGQTHNPDALTAPQRSVASASVLLTDLAESGEMAESVPVSTILEPSPSISDAPSSPTEVVGVVLVFIEFERPVFGTSPRRKCRGRAADLVDHVEASRQRLESHADEVWNAFLSVKAKVAFNSVFTPALFGCDFQK